MHDMQRTTEIKAKQAFQRDKSVPAWIVRHDKEIFTDLQGRRKIRKHVTPQVNSRIQSCDGRVYRIQPDMSVRRIK